MKLAIIHLLITKRVEMLSEHPESTIEPTKTNAFDVAYMDGSSNCRTQTAGMAKFMNSGSLSCYSDE